VFDSQGQPIDNAEVIVVQDIERIDDMVSSGMRGRQSDNTNSEGRYSLERVQHGDVTLFARRRGQESGYQTQTIAVNFGQELTGIDFTLPNAGRLVGNALARANGQPMLSFYAVVNDRNGNVVAQRSVNTEAGTGAYAVGSLSDGPHTLSAFPGDGFAPIYREPFTIHQGGETTVNLSFSEGGALEVTVTNQDDVSISNAKVELLGLDGEELTLPPSWPQLAGAG
jgi:hypothetical protein